MKDKILIFFALILAALGAFPAFAAPEGKIVVAYVTSWSDAIPDPRLMTHINYAFGHVNESFNGVSVANPERLALIAGLKKEAPALKVSLSIGGWGSGRFSEMAADPKLRKAFALDCARVVKEYDLDGIDIDWEYPTSDAAGISASPDDTKNFTLLMRDIRKAIGKNKELTLATVYTAEFIDMPAIMPYVDFVNVMSYDMGGGTKHHATLYRSAISGKGTVDEAMKAHLKAGVPASKLVVGLPFYGRSNKSEYCDFGKMQIPEGWKERWDDTAKAPYFADSEGNFIFGYDNPRSMALKCDYIIDNGFLGAMYWEYAADDADNTLAKLVAEKILDDDKQFQSRLERSGYIHRPLPLEEHRSLESVIRSREVTAEKPVVTAGRWRSEGFGRLTEEPDSGRVVLSFPTSTGSRASGPANDPDYAIYGKAIAILDMKGFNAESFNRLAFDIRPECEGMRVVNMNLSFNNKAHGKKGFNPPTGSHLINLKNGESNCCILEIADLQRDRLDNLTFDVSLNGRDITTGDSARFMISNIRFQKCDKTEKVAGWEPDEADFALSMTGYNLGGKKTAIVNRNVKGEFSVVDARLGKPVFTGNVTPEETTIGTFGVLDFSALDTPGEYRIRIGEELLSPKFRIGDEEIWDNSMWRVLNFIYAQRCGAEVPGIHGKCHTDLFAVHDGVKIPYSGGWHDAGDLSQQTLQTAEVAHALLRASQECKERNPVLSARLAEEARWGLDFEVRSRFGDGHRASSMGLLIWQDGKHDTFDDITTVRVQNVALDNYLHAAFEAYAASCFDDDPQYAAYLAKIAREDFDFAEEEFRKTGLGGWVSMMEHTYNTSMSQMMASVSWSASQLFKLTGEERYARRAAEAMGYVLDCQATDSPSSKENLSGFFYRDKTKKVPVHFIHQSRDQIYMQALEALCATQPEHPDHDKWLASARLWGDYVKNIMKFTAPYGIIPAGVYRDDEYEDKDSFYKLHLFAPENAEELFKAQFREGVALDEHFALKRFPIWFSIFNGNTAIHSSTGIGAAAASRLLGDKELADIAREQLYWTVGKNPFAQSLIYGEGARYPMMNSFSSGEITGEMPVGIRTIGNSDTPYWPQINNACYKEVWVTSAGKWLLLLASLASSPRL